ncbi:SIR2 family protein [Lonsdalea quercina]|uniref:SIR2 family protein n=1 Tax=Lonsdalea quercina TaxID=71657 RepID=UPI0039751033
MEIINVFDDKFKKIIKSCIDSSGLIPVIGAGFTKGAKARNGKVPDGEELIEIMISRLKKEGILEESKIDRLKKSDFKTVSRYYMSEEYVSRDSFIEDIKSRFTGVNIDGVRRTFIKNKWKYIYTLNVDDAIERANNDLFKVLPYKELEKRIQDINLLYKIHGCAVDEVTYQNTNTLIFSEAQYIRSLTKNEYILHALKNDMLESNLLYIGCSLNREIDLMSAVSGISEDNSISSKRIYISKGIPDEMDVDALREYGINTIGVVDDYDDIYYVVNEMFLISNHDNNSSLNLFDSNNVLRISDTKDENIRYMLQGNASIDDNAKDFRVPYYLTDRKISKDIIESISKKPITIIKGRRFSGKSLLLKIITAKIKDKKTYFIPSQYSLNIDDINRMCNVKNSVFLIDTNVVSYIEASEIRKNINQIKSNSTTFVISCNPTEIDIANAFGLAEIDSGYLELENHFDKDEIINFNHNVSRLGIIGWSDKFSILDNTYKTARHYPSIEQKIFDHPDVDNNELKLLIMLAILDKVYISLSREIGFGNSEAADFQKKYGPIVELLETTGTEVNKKSKYKLVINSKTWIFKIIRDQTKNLGTNKTSSVMVELISEFLRNKQLEDVGKKLMMFDTINQFFSRQNGAGRLLTKLYEDLQPLLNQEPDYWLQRAKAMGRILNKPEDILDAIDYAKKAFNDGNRQKTVMNAEFTIANLYGKICEKTNYENLGLIKEAIFWYSSAINKYHYNKNYLNSMLEITKDKKGYLYSLCQKILTSNHQLGGKSRAEFNQIYNFIRR